MESIPAMTHTSGAARRSRVFRLATLVPAALLGAVAMAGCGAESTAIEASSAEKVRTAAQVAGDSPRTCPVTLNVAKALRAGGQAGDATFTKASASVSTSEEQIGRTAWRAEGVRTGRSGW